MKKLISTVSIAFLGGIIALGGYKLLLETPNAEQQKQTIITPNALQNIPTNYPTIVNPAITTDFTKAAEVSLHAVVHVKNKSVVPQYGLGSLFFGANRNSSPENRIVGSGSGVIISQDGYIVTNNHVIQGAQAIEITLNNKKNYIAKVIGEDQENDIALLKIEEEDLPYIPFGNSDNVKVGEWALAVGNPFNLTSTVTAGIISAKGRDLDGNMNVESYIQTDAAVNPGNSGGALVNTNGELIGINTAISSRTGSFIGYSFAVPSNITKRIIEDIMEYGDVQNAIMGFSTTDLDKLEIESDISEGVYVKEVFTDSGASKGGLLAGDIIIKVDDIAIKSFPDLKGFLSSKRPGDIVSVQVLRNDRAKILSIELTKRAAARATTMGMELEEMSKQDLKNKGIKGGVKVVGVKESSLKQLGLESGYILFSVNNKTFTSMTELKQIISNEINSRGYLKLGMINNKGEREFYTYR